MRCRFADSERPAMHDYQRRCLYCQILVQFPKVYEGLDHLLIEFNSATEFAYIPASVKKTKIVWL
jgi:hypothetical protein